MSHPTTLSITSPQHLHTYLLFSSGHPHPLWDSFHSPYIFICSTSFETVIYDLNTLSGGKRARYVRMLPTFFCLIVIPFSFCGFGGRKYYCTVLELKIRNIVYIFLLQCKCRVYKPNVKPSPNTPQFCSHALILIPLNQKEFVSSQLNTCPGNERHKHLNWTVQHWKRKEYSSGRKSAMVKR